MKTNYFLAVIFGIMVLTYTSRSQNILFDGDFSQTTEITPFDDPTPPLNAWAFWVDFYGSGSEANPIVVDGVCVFQIINSGDAYWNVQLGQWGFPLTQNHSYRLTFEVKADSDRIFHVFLGEDGGNYTNLLGYSSYYSAETEWKTITINFEATSVFALHKLSFELGTDNTTAYFDNIFLEDLGPVQNKVSLYGNLQDELGCESNYDFYCDKPSLLFNSDLGVWEGTFILPEGCYSYSVKENEVLYGENGLEWGGEINLYIPYLSEITFSYDPQTHIITSSPFSGVSQEVTEVSLFGSLQNEIGCGNDYEYECENSVLSYNAESGLWEGSFFLPAGCYFYQVREVRGCQTSLYGENGEEYQYIELYVPSDGEVTFRYDTEAHLIESTPYTGVPQEVTSVSLYGSLQEELGCNYDHEYECDKAALSFNPVSALWEASFTLPAGCYSYLVKETFGCNVTTYGAGGNEGSPEISLYLPSESQVLFSYNPNSHIIHTTPDIQPGVTKVSLYGTLQDELGCSYEYQDDCESGALTFNDATNVWEGTFTLPAGCYYYWAKETSACGEGYYGENGSQIELYVPVEADVTFTYDPENHTVFSTPYDSAPEEVTNVSLIGTLQDELGCSYDYEYDCDFVTLTFNPETDLWDGSFTLPAGCYSYRVKESAACEELIYGDNGNDFQLFVPIDSEITFSYNSENHTIYTTPYSGVPNEVTKVSLVGSLQDELGCDYDYNYDCDSPALTFNPATNMWDGNFVLPAGCYTYRVIETDACNTFIYGENGVEWGNEINLFIPVEDEITFNYDPETHIISSTPYYDISTTNQCPETIYVNNTPGTCGAIVNYPGFVVTTYCGGDISSVNQIEGLSSGSIFPIGTTTNIYELTKNTGEVEICSFDIVVSDSETPVIADLNEISETLWPPNHKMVPIFLAYSVSDNCSEATTILSVSSNEAQSGRGKGDQAPDWEIIDNQNVLLRAERDPKGTGREYYITIRVTDEAGNYTEEVVTVRVPLNNGKATEDLTETDNYKLYPSPADEVVKIKGPESVAGRSYSIYDMLGVMKLSGIIRNDMVEVFSLPNGTYVLKFTTDKGTVSKQFIKH